MSIGLVGLISAIGGENFYLFDEEGEQALLIMWGLFTTALWTCTFVMNKTICALFTFLALAFYLLAGDF